MKIKGIVIVITLAVLLFVFIDKEQAGSIKLTAAQESTELEEADSQSISNALNPREQKIETQSVEESFVNDVAKENEKAGESETGIPAEVKSNEAGLEQAAEFIPIDSELYKTLLEKLHSEHSSEAIKEEPFIILDDALYVPYVTDMGIEFFHINTEFIDQIMEEADRYNFELDIIKKDVEQQTDENSENEVLVYQLIEEFNSAEVQLINISCRGHICLMQLAHPHNSINVMEALFTLIKKKRQQCGCKALYTASSDFTESAFKFIFD